MKKVLIVEDNAQKREILAEEFKNAGVKALQAGNGQEGLDVALKQKPDLILLDLMMPIMGGLEMLTKLRAQEAGKDVKVIILTDYGDFSKVAEAVEKGICSYLVKSDVTNKDLVERVKKLIEEESK